MQTIDFYKLSRPVQERFVGSTNGMGLPAPILRAQARPREPLIMLGVSVLASVLLVVAYKLGYGQLASRNAIQGVPLLAVDCALISVAVAAFLRALAVWRDHRVSPFRRGIYVFPVGLIDARAASLRMYPIETLGDVSGPDSSGEFTLSFGSKSFRFPIKNATQAEAAKTELASARGRIEEADTARESIRPKALAALDPLQGFANPLASSEPMVRRAPAWATFGWAFAIVTGAVLGTSVWVVHNAMSDDAMYARASAAGDVASLQTYLAKGSRHKEKVAGELLPRAELQDAEKIGTVDAIEQYMKAHPSTAIGDEVNAALKTALQAELDVAKRAGTLAALDAFVAKHPQSHLDADVATARHGVYQAALAKYEQTAPAKGQSEIAFVERLLAFAEKKGPPVEIRFHRLESKSIDKADAAVQKHRLFKGVVSDPSHYFDSTHAKPHEDDLASTIVQRFAQAFPTEILALAVGEPISDPAAPLPAQILVPTLFIEHGPAWSGSIVASHSPSGVFVGLQLLYEAIFRIPDDPKALHLKVDSWKGPALLQAKNDDKPEETIYGKMQDEGFDQFKKKVVGSFFKSK